MLFLGYDYMRNQLGSLKGVSLSPRCCWNVKSLFFHYVFIWSRGMTRSPRFRLSKRNEMNKITTASLARRKLYECVCTYLNQQIVKLIFITWLWTCAQSGGMKQTLYKHKIYFPAYWASPSIGIFFLYKHTLGK